MRSRSQIAALCWPPPFVAIHDATCCARWWVIPTTRCSVDGRVTMVVQRAYLCMMVTDRILAGPCYGSMSLGRCGNVCRPVIVFFLGRFASDITHSGKVLLDPSSPRNPRVHDKAGWWRGGEVEVTFPMAKWMGASGERCNQWLKAAGSSSSLCAGSATQRPTVVKMGRRRAQDDKLTALSPPLWRPRVSSRA